jgi:hypothetical protein
MADNSKKLSELSTAANVSSTDRVLILRDPSGSPSTRTITVANLFLFSATLTSNNTTFVGNVTAANVVSNAQLIANLATYTTTASLTSNLANYQLTSGMSSYQTTAGLSSNVAILTANAATYLNGKTESNLNVNSAINANNTSFVGTVSAANVVSNNQLSSNLANYQTTAGLSANIAAYLPTYTGIVNGASHTVGSNFIANSTVLTFTPNTFNLGSVSKTANGYVWLPNGVLCQWGTVLANTTTGNTTFPIAFPTACQSVNFSVIGSANVAYQSAAPNTTVATIRTSSTTTAISVQYKAIGY